MDDLDGQAASRRPTAPDVAWLCLAWLGLAFLGIALLLHAAGMVLDFGAALGEPFGLDYGEGIVWQQAALIPGPLMYARPDGFPMIVFHYPPVYYLLVRLAAIWVPDLLTAGRLVAEWCTLLLPPLVATLVLAASRRPMPQPALEVGVAVAAGLALTALDAVRTWGFVMRVDMPGYVCVLAALLVAARADGRFRGTVVALLLCLAAAFTKQTLLCAAAAIVLVGVVRRPRPVVAAAFVAGAAGLAVLLGLQAATGGGFLVNVLGANLNRISLDQAVRVLETQAKDAPLILAFVVAAAWVWRLTVPRWRSWHGLAWSCLAWHGLAWLRQADPVTARRMLLLTHFVLTSATLVTIAKVGSNFNYLIEWLASGAVLLGVALVELARRGAAGHRWLVLALVAMGLVIARWPARLLATEPDPAVLAAKTETVARIAAAARPVSSEDMTLLMRAGQRVVYEPAIATELASVGRWDEEPLVEMMRSGGFGFVLTSDGGSGPTVRRTPAVNAALQAVYPRVRMLAPGLWLREKP